MKKWIISFLHERYEEEVRDARFAISHGDWDSTEWYDGNSAEHGQRWSPRRVIAECEMKRRIANQFWFQVDRPDPAGSDPSGTEALWVLKQLASVYADHPEYQQAWKP